MRLGIVASSETYRQHLEPVWDALEPQERKCFSAEPQGEADVWLTASARDHNQVWRLPGFKVVMEHGCGLEFYSHHTLSRRIRADVIAAPNGFLAQRYRSAGARGRIEVIGTPKMDALSWIPTPLHDTVAVSFHWSGISRQTVTPLEVYREALVELSGRVKVIGHAHPRVWAVAERFYREVGIEPLRDFAEVVERAFVYCVDHSSTAYEWAALGRPVVLMDRGGTLAVPSPTGLRYEHYADIGPHVTPQTLATVAGAALNGDPEHAQQRRAASQALFPHLGDSTARTVAILRSL